MFICVIYILFYFLFYLLFTVCHCYDPRDSHSESGRAIVVCVKGSKTGYGITECPIDIDDVSCEKERISLSLKKMQHCLSYIKMIWACIAECQSSVQIKVILQTCNFNSKL